MTILACYPRLIKFIVVLGLMFTFSPIAANAKPLEAFPGGFVEIPVQSQSEQLYLNKQRLLITDKGTGKFAVVGIPVEQKPGTIYVERLSKGKYTQAHPIKVVDKKYPSESLTIKNKSKVKPPQQNMERIKEERVILKNVLTNWTYKPIGSVSLAKPVQGRLSGEFGTKRLLNGELKSLHRGIDIAAPTGTPVKASANGTVTLSKDLYYTGNTVVIDHGQGWQTVYCHLDRLDAELNQTVTDSTVIGTVGQTGRATGPHLHFGMILNNARVDPSLFWKLNN